MLVSFLILTLISLRRKTKDYSQGEMAHGYRTDYPAHRIIKAVYNFALISYSGIIPVDQIRGRLYGSLILKNVYNDMQADNFNTNPVLI